MARNSVGTYSLPAGNPVVTGTTITTTWANNTLDDVEAELTNSLDRGGRGAMTAPLQASNGTNAAPSVTFGTDTDTGLYRVGANNPGMSVGGTSMQEWAAGGTTVHGVVVVSPSASNTTALISTATGTGTGLAASGGGTSGTGAIFGGGAPNGIGIQALGQGTGAGGVFAGGSAGNGIEATASAEHTGVYGVGGPTSGLGVSGVGGAPNGTGVSGTGTGVGAGVDGTGGATGTGVVGTGGATSGAGGVFTAAAGNSNGVTAAGHGSSAGVAATGGATGIGVTGAGGGTAAGASFANGTAQNATTARAALTLTNGNLNLSGVTNLNADVVVPKNTLSPTNIIKAHANITTTATPAINGGFNVASGVIAGNVMTVNLVTAMADTNYTVITVPAGFGWTAHSTPTTTSAFEVVLYDQAGSIVPLPGSYRVHLLVIGAQ